MNSISPQLTQDEELRRALSKVYALLIKLADEVENDPTPSEINAKEEETQETANVL